MGEIGGFSEKSFLMKSDGTVAGAVKRGLYCS